MLHAMAYAFYLLLHAVCFTRFAECAACAMVMLYSLPPSHAQIYPADVEMWLERLRVSPLNKMVHYVRDPIEMVGSGYLYHLRGSERHWTGSPMCSRDVCSLPDSWGEGLDLDRALKVFESQQVEPWLHAYGCPHAVDPARTSYHTCLQTVSLESGLVIEANRARSTLEMMVDLYELTSGSSSHPEYPRQTVTVELNNYLAADGTLSCNNSSTIMRLIQFLIRDHEGVDGIQPNAAYQFCDGKVSRMMRGNRVLEGMATGVLSTRALVGAKQPVAAGGHAQQQMAAAPKRNATNLLLDSVRAWMDVQGGTPLLRELSGRLHPDAQHPWFVGGRRPPLFKERRPAAARPGSRAVLTCAAPFILAGMMQMLRRLQQTGCDLPIQVWHVGELQEKHIQSVREGGLGLRVDVRNLMPWLGAAQHAASASASELNALRGYPCKPLAMLATDFDEVMLVASVCQWPNSPPDAAPAHCTPYPPLELR